MRVVLDTSVMTSALRSSTGASNALLRFVATQKLVPLVTTALFLEYEDVLKRAEQRLVHGLDSARIDRFLAALASASVAVNVRYQWRPQLSDANDEMVLEAAINGRADALVTHNIKDFKAIGTKFNLRIMLPSDVLAEMRK
jgi:putative PIN family toxin of toxin-antitoxin system